MGTTQLRFAQHPARLYKASPTVKRLFTIISFPIKEHLGPRAYLIIFAARWNWKVVRKVVKH